MDNPQVATDRQSQARLDEEAEADYLAGRLPPHVLVHEWLARLTSAAGQPRITA